MPDTFTNSDVVIPIVRSRSVSDIWHSYDTDSGAMAETLAPGVSFELLEVRIHLNTASTTAENFTITLDAGAGTVCDVVLCTDDMNAVKDYVWRPDMKCIFTATDELDFAWANSNSRTWGLEVIWKKTNN